MARINLLPWREEARQQKQKDFVALMGMFALVAGMFVLVAHIYNNQLIEAQTFRNNFIDSEIKRLDEKIREIRELEAQKQRLLDRMRAIEQLQTNRPLIVRFFDELVLSLPEGVSVTNVNQREADITINGVAQSNARVSSFMRNLESSEWLADPELDIIQAQDESGQRVSRFTLRFKQVIPGEEEDV